MTFDKEEVLKTLYEDLAYNEFTYDQDYGPDMVDMPFHELDKRLKELVTQAYQAGREEEREELVNMWVDIEMGLFHFCYRKEADGKYYPTITKQMRHKDCGYCKERENYFDHLKETK